MNKQNWKIEYYSDRVEKDILDLPDGLLAKYFYLADLLSELGPNLSMPHARNLGKDLYELRIKAVEGIARVFYMEQERRIIVMLHSFVKKTQKIPMNILETARTRQRIYNQYGRQ